MRLARFGDDHRTGLVVDGHAGACVVDVVASLPAFGRTEGERAAVVAELLPQYRGLSGPWPWSTLIDEWDAAADPLQRLAEWAAAGGDAVVLPVEEAGLHAPYAETTSRFFAIGGNFATHAAGAWKTVQGAEGDRPKPKQAWNSPTEDKRNGVPPWGFNVLPGTVIGPDDPAIAPPGVQKLDYEGEVAVVLRVTDTGPAVWAITGWNDLSIRDLTFGLGPRADEGPHRWSLQKNFDTGYACGPWLVVGEGLDPDRVTFRTRVNGELRQEGTTADMVYTFQDVVENVGYFLTLRSGDGIASGTPPGTALEGGIDGPYLEPGDVVEVELDGVGVLRNPVGTA